MTLTPRQYFMIGTTHAGLTNVESLTSLANMAPAVEYRAYQETEILANLSRRGVGFAAFVWTWGFVPTDLFNALRALCPGASAAMYIRTRIESADEVTAGGYLYYTATMIWPDLDSYQYRAGSYQTFQLLFVNPLVYTP
jgi:hypothetical protein